MQQEEEGEERESWRFGGEPRWARVHDDLAGVFTQDCEVAMASGAGPLVITLWGPYFCGFLWICAGDCVFRRCWSCFSYSIIVSLSYFAFFLFWPLPSLSFFS